ncbi:integrase arm-type DNA-binding domain-containing protein [Klebsiella quasipneumoniae subsp. similipneumoniae]|nr:integrase arm-type DNA-binding domain-containing protein [Klebsiella pneumoniae]HBS3677568.1 integrase arm-type DNA-binding domain-containing protein [Klebsiella quasipneumoniae subsp. similipneumoniae]
MALRTDREIASLKTENGKRRSLAVSSGAGAGLYIEVRPDAVSKSWLYRYQFAGKAKKMTLGSYPSMSLTEARKAHMLAMAVLNAGQDPIAVARADQFKSSSVPTFSTLFREWMDWKAIAKPLKLRSVEAYEHTFNVYMAELHKLLVTDLSRSLMFNYLAKLRKQTISGAKKSLTILQQALDYAVNTGIITINPSRTIRPSDIGATAAAPRQRWLEREEVAAFWAGLEKGGAHPAQVNCLKLILLTGARRTEATEMRWEEIVGNKWIIPAERSKNSKSHTITLHQMAQDIIAHQRAISGGSEFVFEAIRGYKGFIDGNALRWLLERVRSLHMSQSEPFTCHDLRRSFASGCAEYLDANEAIIELALNHAKRDRLVATYQAGKRAAKVEALFLEWGEFIQTLTQPEPVKTSNVVAVQFGRRK